MIGVSGHDRVLREGVKCMVYVYSHHDSCGGRGNVTAPAIGPSISVIDSMMHTQVKWLL